MSVRLHWLLRCSDAVGSRPDQVASPVLAALEDANITAITSDSRQVNAGGLFAALPGWHQHGIAHVEQALQRGASVILTDKQPVDGGVSERALVLVVPEVARVWARICAAWHGDLPKCLVGVTGTNGKTSTVSFVRQLWWQCGHAAASLGTLGMEVVGSDGDNTSEGEHGDGSGQPRRIADATGGLTTASAFDIAARLADLARGGVDHVAMEASSHGLAQYRLDGLRFAAAAVVHMGEDHLDYHGNVEGYVAAKCRLFSALLGDGAMVVIKRGIAHERAFVAAARAARRAVLFVEAADNHALADVEAAAQAGDDQPDQVLRYWLEAGDALEGMRLSITFGALSWQLRTRLAARYHVSNAVCAAALCIASGTPPQLVMRAMESLTAPRGRFELVSPCAGLGRGGGALAGERGKVARAGESNAAVVIIDYAHTADALMEVLREARHLSAGRLHVVFGAGGERDKSKRAVMGEVAANLADVVWLTDDNPRGEDAAAIRSQVRSGMRQDTRLHEIGDRALAIRAAIADADGQDVVLIAGKGHEATQVIGDTAFEFSDHEVVKRARNEQFR